MSDESKVFRNNDRAIKKGKKANLTTNQYSKIKEVFKDALGNVHCCFCGKVIYQITKYDSELETLEHLDSVKIAGTTASNTLVSCKKCNNDKGDRSLDWYFEQWFYTEERYEKIVEAHTMFDSEVDIKTVVYNDPNLEFESYDLNTEQELN